MNRPIMHAMAGIGVFLVLVGTAWTAGTFEGRKKCYNFHKSQGESWDKTLHAKAIESLKTEYAKRSETESQTRPEEGLHQGQATVLSVKSRSEYVSIHPCHP